MTYLFKMFSFYGRFYVIHQFFHLIWELIWSFLVSNSTIASDGNDDNIVHGRIYRILWRSAWFDQDYHDLKNFLLIPSRLWSTLTGHTDQYDDPNQIWTHPQWTLHGVNASSVWFSRSPTDQDVLDIRQYPFVWYGQNTTATHILQLSHHDFWLWMEEQRILSDYQPRVNTIFIWTSARAGSTLLGQILARVPHTKVISEPFSWAYLVGLRNKGMMSGQDEAFYVRALLLLTLKMEEERDPGVRHVVIKFPRMCTPQIGLVQRALPQGKHVFLSRQPDQSIGSWLRIAENLQRDQPLFYRFGLRPVVLNHISLPYTPVRYRSLVERYRTQKWTLSLAEIFALSYGGSIACLAQQRQLADMWLTYDELVNTDEIFTRCRVITSLLEKCAIHEFDLPDLMDAFESPSQKSLMNSRHVASSVGDSGQDSGARAPHEITNMVNGIFRDLQLPLTYHMSSKEFRAFIADFTMDA
ncbi:hypothetical protein TCAL_14955 [Tigriopus californicus]|uniref:Sulfotransferase domain-containing protein n=1 Tax=Tigriopus californicus TaxID=6832 RepID=A0A553N9Q4_TIGCA|nr:hypothetical protein TCAL_14955 [Tigriopus californicus]